MSALKVGIAMSGGVDSTLSALLLREKGYEVQGFFMLLPLAELDDQVQRVREVAAEIDIPLHLIDLRQQFNEQVIGSFLDLYRRGLTPNPCVICNRHIKFGLLFEAMLEAGMDRVATGHYARISSDDRGAHCLLRGRDPAKDQSYFLCRLPPDRLARIIFPLGDYRKQDVYAEIAALGLKGFAGRESQDVCFLDRGLAAFLDSRGSGETRGDIVDRNGTVLGSHSGISRYTVGQRRGLGLPDATPWYVIGLDPLHNRVIVGKNDELFSRRILVSDLRWLSPPGQQNNWHIQLRSRHRPAAATLKQVADNRWLLTCREPQRAITPGQFAVLYHGEQVMAGGIILGSPEQ